MVIWERGDPCLRPTGVTVPEVPEGWNLADRVGRGETEPTTIGGKARQTCSLSNCAQVQLALIDSVFDEVLYQREKQQQFQNEREGGRDQPGLLVCRRMWLYRAYDFALLRRTRPLCDNYGYTLTYPPYRLKASLPDIDRPASFRLMLLTASLATFSMLQ